METICLLEAGNYLLGIDAAAIIRKQSVKDFLAEEQAQPLPLIHLSSFFGQQPLATLQSTQLVIEMESGDGPLALLLDRLIDEIEAPDRFEPLPLLYPGLAKLCCPRVMTHDDQIVLLLDVRELDSVRAKLKTTCGLITLDELRDREGEVEDVEQAVSEPETKVVADDVTSEDENRPLIPALEDAFSPDGFDNDNTEKDTGIAVSAPEEPPAVDEPESSGTESKSGQDTIEINDATFSKIVFWTISNYLECESKSKFAINADALPSGLIRQQGLSGEIVQAIINKTILKCEKTDDEALRRKIQSSLQ
jgi:hypothetical protein